MIHGVSASPSYSRPPAGGTHDTSEEVFFKAHGSACCGVVSPVPGEATEAIREWRGIRSFFPWRVQSVSRHASHSIHLVAGICKCCRVSISIEQLVGGG